MPPVELFKQLFSQSKSRGARSTALRPLNVVLILLISGMISGYSFGSPPWVLSYLGVAFAFTMAIYLLSYCYLLFTDRDALRSESFTIKKLAIEKGLVGDNITGKMLSSLLDDSIRLVESSQDIEAH